MRRELRRSMIAAATPALIFGIASLAFAKQVGFTEAERAMILSHGPWPVRTAPDPSNRFSGKPPVIAFGRTLFFSKELSAGRDLSCASCHIPAKGFADGRQRSTGARLVDRNAIGLANLRLNRWFGWAGQSDTLWAQSIHPILDSRELGLTARTLAARISANEALARAYRAATGVTVTAVAPEQVLVAVAKALAAFQETLTTGRTPFDRFRDALASGDAKGIAAYPESAKRGLKIFVGKGNCSVCHFGPNFTNGEFHNIGMIHFVEPGRVDAGRYGGLRAVKASRYNLLGPFNDDPTRATAGFTRRAKLHPRNWGEFRVPSLRNLRRTAPYMHDGSKATLRDVILHYSLIDEERLHSDGERLLRPLRLKPREIDDLIAFLRTLEE